VADLGSGIGSRDWARGLATCAALCAAAYALAPSIDAIPGASPPAMGEAQHEEMRALSIAPLAYGADTGRRMAATDAVQPLTDTPERPSVNLVATLGRGDGFTRVLERAGVAGAEASAVARMVAGIVPVETIRPGTAMELTLGRRPNRQVARPLEALSLRARFDLRLSIKRIDGKLTIAETPILVDETPLRIQGLVGSSLYRSARAAGAPPKAVEAYIRAVAGQLNIGEVGGDDRFDIVLEHRRAETGESEFGKLLYAGLQRSNGRSLQLMQWQQDGRVQWFEASGVGKARGLLQRPVQGQVTSSFGIRRHPILGYTRMHRGMDFRAATARRSSPPPTAASPPRAGPAAMAGKCASSMAAA
jgi:murein DD-endopeptidase MepM/ murein hydrolase activator NlpD